MYAHWYEEGTWSGKSGGIEPDGSPIHVQGQTRFLVNDNCKVGHEGKKFQFGHDSGRITDPSHPPQTWPAFDYKIHTNRLTRANIMKVAEMVITRTFTKWEKHLQEKQS